MSALQVTWLREVRTFRRSFAGYLPIILFLSVVGWSFVMVLRKSDGGVLQIQTIWGMAVSPWVPVLCSVLTMRLFAEERSTGMIDLLLSVPVRERELVLGKYLAAWTMTFLAVTTSLATPLVVLPWIAPALKSALHPAAFVLTWLILMLQSSLWCAVGTMVSVCFRNQTLAAVVSILVCGGIPLAFYAVILAWMPEFRLNAAWMPLITNVYDFSTGLVSSFALSVYVVLTWVSLFICSKLLALLRL
ncbi:MAG: ABC transporter permease subunit [bacterium]